MAEWCRLFGWSLSYIHPTKCAWAALSFEAQELARVQARAPEAGLCQIQARDDEQCAIESGQRSGAGHCNRGPVHFIKLQ